MDLSTIFVDSLAKWNISALKDELRRKNLNATGEKAILIKRLQEFYERELRPPVSSAPLAEQQPTTPTTSAARMRLPTGNPFSPMIQTREMMTTPAFGGNFGSNTAPTNLLLDISRDQHETTFMGADNHELSNNMNPMSSLPDTVAQQFIDVGLSGNSSLFAHNQLNPPLPNDSSSPAGTYFHQQLNAGVCNSPVGVSTTHDQTRHSNIGMGDQRYSTTSIPVSTGIQIPAKGSAQATYASSPRTMGQILGVAGDPQMNIAATCEFPNNSVSPVLNRTNPFLPNYQPLDHATSSILPQVNQGSGLSSSLYEVDELSSLQRELKILKAKDEIRNMTYRLSLPPDTLRSSHLNATGVDIGSMLSLVKKSVDINSLPPAKPIVFSGNPLDYTQWKSTFDLLIEDKQLSPAQKLSYLQNYLSGKALRCIQGYIMFNTAEAYDEARKTLDERFGDPFEIADSFRDKLEAWAKISDSDAESLREYADFLKQCKLAMMKIPELDKLNDPRELKNMVSCLPNRLLTRWSRESGLRKLEKKTNPVFSEYADFVMREALLACDKTTSYGALVARKKDSMKPKNENAKPTVALATQADPTEHVSVSMSPQYCQHCKVTKSHDTTECRKITKMTYEEQQDFMRKENLCFECLQKGHAMHECPHHIKCLYPGCGDKHPTCTHHFRSKAGSTQPKRGSTSKQSSVDRKSLTLSANVNKIETQPTIQKLEKENLTSCIVPVYISSPESPEHETLTYALVDNMSNTSIIRQDICDALFTTRVRKKLSFSTVTTPHEIAWCDKITNLQVRGIRSHKSDRISVPSLYTRANIPANREHIPTPDTAECWEHLKHLKEKLVPLQNCEVGLIIGYNCSAASLPLITINDANDLTLPYAVKTILGWSIVGGKEGDQYSPITHRISARELSSEEVLKRLEEDLAVTHDTPPMSQNDILFLKKMEKSITITDGGHYTMNLPFKHIPNFSDNRSYVLKRFRGLESRLNSSLQLKQKYVEFMDDIVAKGEAQIAPQQEANGWYIPHFGVLDPHKSRKLRVVFDCSASFKGQSLNKHLLQGPDLNNSLAGLLCRFRKERVAVTCDIKKMFHQFRVSKDDRKYLKFLWYEKDTDNIIDYQMNVHLFGAVSSPSCAIYGLQQIAKDHASDFPTAASFVKDNFYVDDGLASVSTAEEAIQLMSDAKTMLSKGNLVLHKFLSNNDDVAKELDCEQPTTKVITGDQSTDRALGICWNTKEDMFTFSEIPIKANSRRGILSTVASLFDPLGFLTPYTLSGKLLLQTLCYDKRDWDDPLSSDQEKEWIHWTSCLANLKDMRIPRCLLSSLLKSPYTVELHTFSDASSVAYGVCTYVRMINQTTGNVSVSLVMGKSRVAPKKKVLTIPRLELQAATLAVKVGGYLQKELKYPDIACHYWTDSEAVLGYISNEGKRFHIFVCNRVERIRDTSSAESWRYVSSAENPADIASRGSSVKDIPNSWFRGPQFLHDAQFSPRTITSKNYPLNTEDPEVKKVFVNTVSTTVYQDILSSLVKHSSWAKITRIMSVILKVTKREKGDMDLTPAGNLVFLTLVRLIQRDVYSEEINLVQQKLPIPKSSPLYRLDVYLDKDNTLRVGGRLKDSLAPSEIKHPVVLASRSPLTKLFIKMKHKEMAHQGRTTTANAIRTSGVYIVGGGIKLVSSVIYNCVKCKKLRGQPIGQKMAALSQHQAEPSAPFSHTGMDVFGPFHVKDGRKECKRYGLLLTCLASRAVHLELLDDMSTDCFINCLRNFLAIRGPVAAIYSDRGTNFVGANNELQKALAEMSEETIQRFLHGRQCQFKFNVPNASHMGGSWERMIRTVRHVMNGILIEENSSRLDTSSLRTLFYECMHIVNSRPLTTHQLSTDTSVEPVPLTPNTLLTMKENTLLPPAGNFSRPDLYSRKRWRRVQYLTEQFWSRWKTEYLQSLQKRQKWNDVRPNLKVNDVVLLVENDQPRSEWRLGRVTMAMKSGDGLVRKVQLVTGNKQMLERPVHKLILLVTWLGSDN